MRKLVPVLVLMAMAPLAVRGSPAVELLSAGAVSNPSAVGIPGRDAALVLVGGMGGGGTGGGMGMGGGGMTGGGMTGGGMTGGGTGGMNSGGTTSGMGGMPGYGGTPTYRGTTGYGDPVAGGGGQPYGSETGGGAQPAQYHCVTQHGQCTVASSPGSLRRGASCTCLFGGNGKIN
jgi:hypothetical protein